MVVIVVELADVDTLGRTCTKVISDAKFATLAGFFATGVTPGGDVVNGRLLA